MVFQLYCTQFNYLHGIRVHEDDNEDPTISPMPIITTLPTIKLNQTQHTHNSDTKHTSEPVHIHDDDDTNASNAT